MGLMEEKMHKRVLVVAAHPDDEVLGVGGTVLKHVKNMNEVYCVIAATGIAARYGNQADNSKEVKKHYKRAIEAGKILGFKKMFFLDFPDNRMDSVALLDVVKRIEDIISKVNPDIIYTHHHNDLNVDHRVCFQAVITACRPIGKNKVKKIFTFETLSSTEWQAKTGNSFLPNVYVNISGEIERKIKAMKKYKTEIRKYPHSRSEEGIRILSAYRGIECGMKNAEAFHLIKSIEE